MSTFALIGGLVTALLCGFGLLVPESLTRQGEFGLRIETPIAMSEMRATYGAMFAIGLADLVMFVFLVPLA